MQQWHFLPVAGVSLLTITLVVTLTVVYLTEITSNTATARLMLPVLGALSVGVDIHPFSLMIPAANATSFAFMLPLFSPPNAIVFASRYVAMTGIWMNVLAVVLITIFAFFIMSMVWCIDPGSTFTSSGRI